MADTPYTQAMLDALKKNFATGTLSLTYEGKEIRYRTLAEMQLIINTVQRELDQASGKSTSRQVRMTSSRGLERRRRDGWCE
jgi:hypothetical protein